MSWNFLTNHANVLIAIARDPDIRLRDVADQSGITERAAQRIVSDLVEAGYVKRMRQGRRNSYEIKLSMPLGHPSMDKVKVGELIKLIA